jgi:hypothetical protein
MPRFFGIALAEMTVPREIRPSPALVLARKDENRVAFGNVLASVHRLLRFERERFRPRTANLSFDRERHIAPLIHDRL